MIDIFNNLFAHFAQFRFVWVDKPACWFFPEVSFVIFECNESFSLGCSIYSINEVEVSTLCSGQIKAWSMALVSTLYSVTIKA